MKNKAVLALERLLKKVKSWKAEVNKEEDVSRAIFLLTPEKIRKHSLTDFLRMFNYYTNKLLIARSDPFIEKQNIVYLKQRENDEMFNMIDTFDRIKTDYGPGRLIPQKRRQSVEVDRYLKRKERKKEDIEKLYRR